MAATHPTGRLEVVRHGLGEDGQHLSPVKHREVGAFLELVGQEPDESRPFGSKLRLSGACRERKKSPAEAVRQARGIALDEPGIGEHLESAGDAADLVPGQIREALDAETTPGERFDAAERQQQSNGATYGHSGLALHAVIIEPFAGFRNLYCVFSQIDLRTWSSATLPLNDGIESIKAEAVLVPAPLRRRRAAPRPGRTPGAP